jgi:hypothetical protein
MMSIHTVEARDNAMLDVTFENPEGRGEEIRREIAMVLDMAIKQLSDRGVEYAKLRTALTPQVDKRELALLFDSAVMKSWYGGEAAEAVLPHLDRKSNHSILHGDILFKDLDVLLAALNAEGEFWRETSIPVSHQLYVVYITNLSDGGFERLVDGVRSSRGAIGYVDCTYAGVTKTILSTCIGTQYVKVGSVFVNSHPFDADEDAKENAAGWPLAEHGYSYCSIADLYFDLFLQYKVESVFPGSAFNDGHFSLAAVTGIWADPRTLPLSVDEGKRKYLEGKKGGSLAKAGLSGLSAEEIASKIREKIAANYIYNLVWDSEEGYSNFATMIEFEHKGRRVRLRAVLKFEDGKLGLVSLFG